MPSMENSRPRARVTAMSSPVVIGHLTGRAYQTNSCSLSWETVSSPAPLVSQPSAAFASSAASGSSLASAFRAWASVIMRPVCRRNTPGG